MPCKATASQPERRGPARAAARTFHMLPRRRRPAPALPSRQAMRVPVPPAAHHQPKRAAEPASPLGDSRLRERSSSDYTTASPLGGAGAAAAAAGGEQEAKETAAAAAAAAAAAGDNPPLLPHPLRHHVGRQALAAFSTHTSHSLLPLPGRARAHVAVHAAASRACPTPGRRYEAPVNRMALTKTGRSLLSLLLYRRVLIPAVSAKLANKLKQRYENYISLDSQLFWSNPQRLCELHPESRSWVRSHPPEMALFEKKTTPALNRERVETRTVLGFPTVPHGVRTRGWC